MMIKEIKKYSIYALAMMMTTVTFTSCGDDDDDEDPAPAVAMYDQEDQMGRPAINTVFVTSADKDEFNVTTPSDMGAAFQGKFETQLLALNAGYTTNLLTLDAPTFTGVLASDALGVAKSGVTTFFNGTEVLTGRTLGDDVIDVELILIFGGPTGADNPGLTSDNVGGNDKPFLGTFPYVASPW